MPRQAFNFSTDEDSVTSLNNLFQCLTTRTAKRFFVVFRWNVMCCSFCPVPLILPVGTAEKSLATQDRRSLLPGGPGAGDALCCPFMPCCLGRRGNTNRNGGKLGMADRRHQGGSRLAEKEAPICMWPAQAGATRLLPHAPQEPLCGAQVGYISMLPEQRGSRAEGAALGTGVGSGVSREVSLRGKRGRGQPGNTDNSQVDLAGITLEESEHAAAAAPDERLNPANAKPFCQEACF